jgi:hypothetical protein
MLNNARHTQTKALTRGPSLRVLNRIWDSHRKLEFDFVLHDRELQIPSEKSIKASAHGEQVSGFSAAGRAECAPREAENASAMKTPGDK